MIPPVVTIYTAVALLVLVAALDDNLARQRRDLPQWSGGVILAHAVLWLPVLIWAAISALVDAGAALRRR